MTLRARSGGRTWTIVLLWLGLAIPPLAFRAPTLVAAANQPLPPVQTATYAGTPVAGVPTDVAQQPFGVAVSGRYTFVADPVNHVVRLLVDKSEVPFAGNGGLSVEGDATDPVKAQLAGPYAVAPGQVTTVGYQVTSFDMFIADTFGHQVRKVSVTVPPIDSSTGVPTAVMTTVAGTGKFGFAGDGRAAKDATLNSPYGLAWDPQRNVLYIADTLNNRIRQVSAASGKITSDGAIATAVGTGQAGYSASDRVAARTPLNQPRGLAVDSGGRLYIADTSNNVVRVYDPANGSIRTVAGTGAPTPTAGYRDGVAATTSTLRQPAGVALDRQGNLYIADTGDNVVREVTADGVIHTVAGNGTPGYTGDNQAATQARLQAPFAVAVRPDGDVLIADTGNSYLRDLEAAVSADGSHHIHLLAGNGTPSLGGDGQPPAQAQFAGPTAVASNLTTTAGTTTSAVPQTFGNRFVLDTFNQSIRAFTTADNDPNNHTAPDMVGGTAKPDADEVSTLKLQSSLSSPMGIALSSDGKTLYVADTFNNQVKQFDVTYPPNDPPALTLNRVIGSGSAGFDKTLDADGASITTAHLSYPTGLALDASGDLFIADTYNDRIREVPVQSDRILTVAGSGTLGFTGDGKTATKADLYLPYGVAVDPSGPNLYVVDSFNHRVREVMRVGQGAASTIQTVAGDGAADFADGGATSGHLNRPWSAAVQGTTLYIADYLNQRVRQVDRTTQAMSTLTGIGTAGLNGDIGVATAAEVNGPKGVSPLSATGAVLVADSLNDRIRWVGATQTGIYRTQVSFAATNLAGASEKQTVTVSSTGSGLLVLGPVDVDLASSDFSIDPQNNSCGRARLEPSSSCSFNVLFQPRAPGLRTGNVVIPDSAIPGQQVIRLSGQAVAPAVTLTPPSLGFSQPGDSAAPAQAVVLKNGGDGPLHIASIDIQPQNSNFFQTNNCPATLARGDSCAISVNFKQIAAGTASQAATLVVQDDAAGNPNSPAGAGTQQIVPLTGAFANPVALLNPAGLSFSQNMGGASPPQVIRLVNSGDAPMTVSGIRTDGDFAESNSCPSVLAPKASCPISLSFQPTTTGERDGYVVVADGAPDSPQKISLLGMATVPSASLSTSRLTFAQNVGSTSGPQQLVLRNTGDGPLTIASIGATGDYAARGLCPVVLAPGASCGIAVTFKPTSAGSRSGAVVITDDADSQPGNQQTVRVTGIGHQPVASFTQTVLRPSASVHAAAPATTLVLTNAGDGPLTVRGVGISGGAAGQYRQVNNCVRVLGPGVSCAITVSFTPAGFGIQAAQLTVFDDAVGGAQAILLRGAGTGPNALLSASSLNFGSIAVGDASAPEHIILFNSGTGALTVSQIGSSGGEFRESDSCPAVLPSGASCMITLTFTPSGSGLRTGGLTIIDDSRSGRVQTVSLLGTGT